MIIQTNKKIKIGFPKFILHHEFGVLWETFFKNLGCDVIFSDDTNKKILDNGVKFCSNETCLPVKVLHGQVIDLQNKADYIFIPRYISTNIKEFACPKFCGLPDMVRLNIKKDIDIININIDINKGMEKTKKSLKELADKLSIKYPHILKTFMNAFEAFKEENFEKNNLLINNENAPFIVVLGHPYMIFDDYLSMKLIKKLCDKYTVLTPDNLDTTTKRNSEYPYKGRYFYSIGHDNLGCAYTYINNENIKGIIYLTPFACGVDSLVTEYIEIELKNNNSIPWMKLTVDEHTGEAGFDTRLEAFLDMIG